MPPCRPVCETCALISGAQCPACGAVFNIYSETPAAAGKCDRCGADLVQRSDDHESTVRRRLQVYQEQTAPLIQYYRSGPTPVHAIDGDRPVETVQTDLVAALGK